VFTILSALHYIWLTAQRMRASDDSGASD